MIDVGQRVHRKMYTGSKAYDGTVVWVHPQHRFAVVEYHIPVTAFRRTVGYYHVREAVPMEKRRGRG